MKTAAFALLLAVACLATGATARPAGLGADVIDALKAWGSSRLEVDGWGGISAASNENDEFSLLLKFDVPPSVGDDFASLWKEIQKDLKKQEDLLRLQATSNCLDNRQIFVAQDWANRAAFVHFMEGCDACKRITSFIKKHDIGLKVTQLLPVATHRASDAMAAAEEHEKPHVLMRMCIKPSLLSTFLDAASSLIDTVAEKEGKDALVFSFKRSAFDDCSVWGYAVWTSQDAMEQHLRSGHHEDFHSFLIERDIIIEKAFLTPILEIENK